MMPPTPYAPGVQPAQPAQAPGAVIAQAGDPSNVIELEFNELVRPEEISFGDCLGSGGFGSVYRCTLRGIQVAVKRINVASDAPTAAPFAGAAARDRFAEISKAFPSGALPWRVPHSA